MSQSNNFPQLTTQRLILRRLRMEDAPEVLLLRSDERVNEFLDRPKTLTIHDAEVFIEKIEIAVNKNESAYWAISLKENDVLIGTICLYNFIKERSLAEIGYELMPEFQSRGLMQEVVEKIIEYGFETLELNTITAVPDAGNARSIGLLRKNGFKADSNFEYCESDLPTNYLVYFLNRPGTPPSL